MNKDSNADSTRFMPFEKTIVDFISSVPDIEAVIHILALIQQTTISFNHENIISEIKRRFNFVGSAKYTKIVKETIDSIEKQKT